MADEPVKTDPPAAVDPVKTTPDVTPIITEPLVQSDLIQLVPQEPHFGLP